MKIGDCNTKCVSDTVGLLIGSLRTEADLESVKAVGFSVFPMSSVGYTDLTYAAASNVSRNS